MPYDEIDIYRKASLLVRRYGEEAPRLAYERSQALLAEAARSVLSSSLQTVSRTVALRSPLFNSAAAARIDETGEGRNVAAVYWHSSRGCTRWMR